MGDRPPRSVGRQRPKPLTDDEHAQLMARNASSPMATGQQNQATQNPAPPVPPLPQAPGNAAPGNRPTRPGAARPQFGAMRGQRVPGNPAPAPGNPAPVQGNPAPVQGNPAPAQANPAPAHGNPAPVQPAPAQPAPAPVTAKPVVPQGEQLTSKNQGQFSAKQIDKLPLIQRQWSDNVLRALKLKSKGSQARVLAGALATTAQIELANPADAPRAKALLQVVKAAGDPPWKDTTRAMAAADAAMHLDLLSIPTQQRQLQPLGGGGGGANPGVNTAFFVNRLDADGNTRPAFVCKAASAPKADAGQADKVSGIPNGGEVIREAMASRAAQTFAAQTGIDIAMPETHVVRLSPDFVPGSAPNDPELICSIQEFGPGLSELKGMSQQQKAAIPAGSVAALAVFDLMTLNVDRHSGNVMTDGQGSMMPIDNGASFPQGKGAETRIGEAMASSYNVLLSMPSAYDPMPPAMVKSLKAMKSSDYRAALASDRDQVVVAHPEMGFESNLQDGATNTPMITDQALDWAGKAARFAKLAARATPPLSPAAMQIAFGSYAAELLGADDFEGMAQIIIAQAASRQDITKDVMLSDGSAFAELGREVKALGWRRNERGGSASENRTITDPLMMLSIITNGTSRGAGKEADARVGAFNGMPTPNAMRDELLAFRKRLIAKYIGLMPPAAQAAQNAALTALSGPTPQQMTASKPLMDTCRVAALAHQRSRLDAKLAGGASVTNRSVQDAETAHQNGDPIDMAENLRALP